MRGGGVYCLGVGWFVDLGIMDVIDGYVGWGGRWV